MKKSYILIALLACFFIKMELFSQKGPGFVDSVMISPNHPTSADSIRLITYLTFPDGMCNFQGRNYFINVPDIYNTSSYCIGNYAMACFTQDTIKIAPLSPGQYFFHYNLESAYFLNGCPPYSPSDSTIFEFTVNYPASIESLINTEDLFSVTVQQERMIILLKEYKDNFSVRINDLFGKEVRTVTLNKPGEAISINFKHGLYFITVWNNYKRQTKKIFL